MVEISKLNDMFKEKGISLKCPICQQNSFTGIDKLGALPVFDEQNRSIQMGNPYGMAIMLCNNCHYMMAFNAKGLGLVS